MLIFYSCLPCNVNYETYLQLVDHNTIVHGEKPSIDIEMVEIKTNGQQSYEKSECQYCGEEFSILEYLAKHIASEHPRQTNDFDVKGTIEETVVYGLDKEDILESGISFSCISCKKSYQTKRALREHNRYKHGRCETCSNCNKVFESKMKLTNHVRYNHSPWLYSCALCGKKFSMKRDLERHIVPCAQGKGKKSTLQDPKFTCEMCRKGFSSKDSLVPHIRRKHKVELLNQPTAFKREIFEKYFPMRRKREVPWNCTKCSQSFKKNSHLKRHMLTTHNSSAVLVTGGAEPEDPPNFVCQVCAKEFGSKNVLGRHIKLAHPNLTFNCDQCAKELPSKKSMKQHRFRMHKDTLFVCPLCLAEFRQIHNKRAHMKRCKWRVVTLEREFEL